jgi:uncharacterized protein DUF5916
MRRAWLGAIFIAAMARADVPPPPPPIEIHHTSAPIVIDGDLSDAGWRDAAKIDRFYETSPGDNTPPKVKTTAWLSYDDKYFYIGIRCDDPEPQKIRAPYVERDAVIGTDDNIAVLLDTRNDRKTAMELRVNPRGIQGDGIYNDANSNEDFSPDFFYDTAAKIDGGGWSAEYRIPFSSLRYPHADPQTWNIIIWRNYPREFRYAYQSAPIARGSNCYICHTHPIVGLTHLPESGHLVVAPYVTAQRTNTPTGDVLGNDLGKTASKNEVGADIKWNASANGAIDLTLNPDFSQVESDVPQITVNQRFAVFFPEKRPFFLEGFDLFDTPIQVAYSRTITAPRWGVRSTGKIGGTAYTVLVTDDRGGGLTLIPSALGSAFAPQDFKSLAAIARVRHDLEKAGSFVGAVVTDRENDGGGHNRVIGPDFLWRPNEFDAFSGEFLYSDTETPNRPDLFSGWRGSQLKSHAASFSFSRNKQTYDWFSDVRDIGDNFRADLGFVPQVGYREWDGGGGLHFFPEKGWIRNIRPNIFVDYQQDQHGNTIQRFASPGLNLFGAKNMQIITFAHLGERQRVGTELLPQNFVGGIFQIDLSRRITRITVDARGGERIDFANARIGHGATINLSATLRPIDKTTFDLLSSREWLNVHGDRLYTATIERVRMLYSFSSKSIVRLIGQYQTVNSNPALYRFQVDRHSGQFLGSVLYSYKVNWQTVLFVGYGDDRLVSPDNNLLRADRSVFFKVSYAYQR